MGRDICTHFPDDKKCDSDKVLCSMWRTTGFLMSLAIVAELATVVSFLIIMAGGKMKRERGWKLLGVMLGVVAGIEFCAMGIVVGLRSGLGRWGLNCLANMVVVLGLDISLRLRRHVSRSGI